LVVPRSVLSRATDAVANRLDRRSFLARSAMVGTALVAAPGDLLLRPQSAYAAVCSCRGLSCDCGALCCDGYTEFCCAIYGANACPSGSLIGGWWKADGSAYCGGKARYYMDCHKPCGGCSCGGGGICSGSCNGTPCGCGKGRCDHRKAGCTAFRYGNCNNSKPCIGPIQCRVVTCTQPWKIEPTCSSSAVRTDNNTRSHNRPCLQAGLPVHAVAGDWNGDGKWGIGHYDNRDGAWTLRQTGMTTPIPKFLYGQTNGDRPVVGDWDGDGRDSIAIVRGNRWHFSNEIGSRTGTFYVSPPWGSSSYEPVAGDWNGDGIDTPGLFRTGGYWYLSHRVENPTTARQVRFGAAGGAADVPVVGDWNADGIDGIGVYRNGMWYLCDDLASPTIAHSIALGEPGDLPVVGDWHNLGRVSIGVYRPSTGQWHLRQSLDNSKILTFTWGPKWTVG
jgi:hypothetical protein